MLVLGPNLSIDQTVVVERLRVGTIHRVPRILRLAGGKGGNVARAARRLGGEPLLLGFAGGPAGRQLAAYLRADGIAHHLVPIGGETRACFTIADEATGEQTEFYEAGPGVTPDEVAALLAAVEERAAEHAWLVATGSLPPGAPDDLYARAIAAAHARGARALLDAKGAALALGIAARPDVLKVNGGELAGYVGRALEDPEAVAEAAAGLALGTDGGTVITLGAAGAVVVGAGGRWLVSPPVLRARSPTGSGDCAAAAVVLGLEGGMGLLEAARLGVAAGAANALHVGGARFAAAEVEELRARCTVRPLPAR